MNMLALQVSQQMAARSPYCEAQIYRLGISNDLPFVYS